MSHSHSYMETHAQQNKTILLISLAIITTFLWLLKQSLAISLIALPYLLMPGIWQAIVYRSYCHFLHNLAKRFHEMDIHATLQNDLAVYFEQHGKTESTHHH